MQPESGKKTSAFVALGLAACFLGGLAIAAPQGKLSTRADDALGVAEDAYVFGYPIMLVDRTKAAINAVNRLVYLPSPPPPTLKTVVRPNVDTLYATGFLDLSREPVVVHKPDTHGRYDVMQIMDANTNVFASPGARTTGTDAQDFVLVGPGWRKPVKLGPDMTEIRSPTNMVWILHRTQLDGEADIPAVNDLQRQLAVAPLSQWPTGAVAATPMPAESSGEAPPAQVKGMDAPAYFARLATLLHDNPPPPAAGPAMKRFATIGLVPGKASKPSPELGATLETAKTAALEKIADKTAHLGEVVNGWRTITQGVGTYGTDYLQRAAVAEYGLGANLPADAVYPATNVDETGHPLLGDKRYVLHFDKGETPQVNAFWSLTLYDKGGYFVPNPLNRFAVRDSRLKTNADGSLDIYLQSDSPGKDHDANWLPTPTSGPFTLLLRMYWPKPSVLDGSYRPPGIRPIT
jgi:hypothetical protein